MKFCFSIQKQERQKFNSVYFRKDKSKFIAQICHEAKRYHCGLFPNELEAAQAVNAKCVELNIPFKNPEVGLPEDNPQVSIILKTIRRKKDFR